MSENHQWTESDDLAVLYVYKFGTDNLPFDWKVIARGKRIKIDSFRMRIQNFAYLDGVGKLNHPALLSRRIYEEYHTLPEQQLRKLAFPEL